MKPKPMKRNYLGLLGSRSYRVQMAGVTLLSDLAGFSLAIGFVYLLNNVCHYCIFDLRDVTYVFIILLTLSMFMTSRLYPGIGINPAEEMRLVAAYTSLGLLLGLILVTVLRFPPIDYYWAVFSISFTSLGTILLMRWGGRILAARLGLWGEPVVMIGGGERIDHLTRYFLQRRRLGFVPVLAVTDAAGKKSFTAPMPVIDLRDLQASTTDRFSGEGVQSAVVDISTALEVLDPAANRLLPHLFRHLIFVSDTDWLEGALLHTYDFEGLLGLEACRNVLSPSNAAVKRMLDILLSILLGIFSSPVLLLAALLIRLDGRGPVFYAQERVGKGGRKIKIYKFRSMTPNADQVLADYLATNLQARQEWQQTRKLREDPRITRAGKLLRKFSIDELPQLINVLKGDLSLVGPRPVVEDEAHHYQYEFDVYKSVRPGVTGLWQVSGRNRTSYEERVHYDMYYVRNWSVWLDVYILLRTVWVVLRGDGA